MHHFSSLLAASLLAALFAVTGCTEAEQHLIDAAGALEECDIRGAHTSFEAAYSADSSHPDAALGFALTDTILLPEDPEITAALADIGFTAPLNTEIILWGPDAVLARLSRGESCESVGDFFQASIPYPPVRDSSVNAHSILRDDLAVQDLIDRLQALDGRFERLASAYETAASSMDGREVNIEGGCGAGRMVVQAPELYAGAALFTLLRAVLAIAPTYDWSFTVNDFFSSDPERQIVAFQRLLTVVDEGRANNGRDLLIRAFGLIDRGLEAAEGIRSPVTDAVFDWSSMNDVILADFRLFAARAILSLEESRPEMIPHMSPSISIDLSLFLSSPPDQAALSAPIWSLVDDDFGPYISARSEAFEELISPYFSPALFDDAVSVRWDLGDRWEGTDLGEVFDPNDRYEDAYRCMP